MNAQDNQGWAPIHYATYKGYENTVSVLLKFDADKFLVNKDGKSAHEIGKEEMEKNRTQSRINIYKMLEAC